MLNKYKVMRGERAQSFSEISSPTKKIIMDIERVCVESRKKNRVELFQERKQKSLHLHKKRASESAATHSSQAFKPPSFKLSLFRQESSINGGLKYQKPIRNIERTLSKGSQFADFLAGSTHVELFCQSRLKVQEEDKSVTDLKFREYCDIIDRSDPKCRRRKLLLSKQTTKKPMLFPSRNMSFADTLNSFAKEGERSLMSSGFYRPAAKTPKSYCSTLIRLGDRTVKMTDSSFSKNEMLVE